MEEPSSSTAEAAVPVASTPAIAPPEYDASLLIMVKGKPKKPVRPDETERNVQVAKLQEEIAKHNGRIQELKETIESKRNSARGISTGQQDHVRKLQQLKNEFQSVLRQKQGVREEINNVSKSRQALLQQLRTLREKTKTTTAEALEERIQALEAKLHHESMSPQEERRVHEQLQKAVADRPLVKEYTSLAAKLAEHDQYRDEMSKRFTQCDAVLNGLKAQETEARAALDEVKNLEQGEVADLPALNVEKKECYDIIMACRAKIDELRKEFSERYTEWIKLDKAYNGYMRTIQRQRYDEQRKEREERYKAKEEMMAVNRPEPFEAELYMVEGALTYLRTFSAVEEKATVAPSKDVAAPSGMVLLKKKVEEDERDSLFAGKSGKKGKGAKKSEVKPEKPKQARLHHTLETLKTFMELGVDVPQSTTEVPKALEAVEAKKLEFQEKRRQAKLKPPPQPVAAPAPALPAAAAGANAAPAAGANGAAHEGEDGDENGDGDAGGKDGDAGEEAAPAGAAAAAAAAAPAPAPDSNGSAGALAVTLSVAEGGLVSLALRAVA